MPTFRLVMRSGPSAGKVFPLDKPEIIVGRDLNNDIVINDPEVSRRHARFYLQGNGYVLEDLGSTNGTFINSQRLSGPYILHIGEAITFGERINVVFESEDVPEDSTVVNRPSPALDPLYQVPPPPPPPVYQSQPPAYTPPQPAPRQVQPSMQPLPPQPQPMQGGFAGQVPYQAPAPQPANRNMRTIIILVVVLLLVVCVCLGVGLYLAPKEFWCLFPVWPAGACP